MDWKKKSQNLSLNERSGLQEREKREAIDEVLRKKSCNGSYKWLLNDDNPLRLPAQYYEAYSVSCCGRGAYDASCTFTTRAFWRSASKRYLCITHELMGLTLITYLCKQGRHKETTPQWSKQIIVILFRFREGGGWREFRRLCELLVALLAYSAVL